MKTRTEIPQRPDPVQLADDPAVPAPEPPSRGPRRHAYRAPRLENLGRLAEMTRFGGSEIVDSGSGLGAQP